MLNKPESGASGADGFLTVLDTPRSQGSCRLGWQAESGMIQGAVWTKDREAEAILGEFQAENDSAAGGARQGFGERAFEGSGSGSAHAVALAEIRR